MVGIGIWSNLTMVECTDEPNGAQATPGFLKRKTRLPFIGLAASCLFLTVTLARVITPAWHSAQLSEAYLPDLLSQAKSSPYDGPALALLGGRLIEAREYAQGVDALQRALAAGETDDNIWLNLAAAHAAEGETRLGYADLLLAQHVHKNSLILQDAYKRVENLGPATDPASFANAACPNGPSTLEHTYGHGSILNGLFDWWQKRNPDTSGFATRQRWVRARPNDAQAVRLWGLALLIDRRIPEALETLNRGAALAPNSAEVHLDLAQALTVSGDSAGALGQYIISLHLCKDSLPALQGLGNAALATGGTKYAIAAFQRASQIAPLSVDSWIGLGRASLPLSNDDQMCLNAFNQAALLAPGRTDFATDYAVALLHDNSLTGQTNDLSTAATILRRRLSVQPREAYTHFLLGSVLMRDPSSEPAAELETRQALVLAPQQPLAEAQLGKLLLSRGDAPNAISLLMRAKSANPYNKSVISMLAQAYARTGQTADAANAGKLAAQIDLLIVRKRNLQYRAEHNILDADAHQKLASLYREMGDTSQAAQEDSMAHLIRKNPAVAAQQTAAVQNTVQSVLGLP